MPPGGRVKLTTAQLTIMRLTDFLPKRDINTFFEADPAQLEVASLACTVEIAAALRDRCTTAADGAAPTELRFFPPAAGSGSKALAYLVPHHKQLALLHRRRAELGALFFDAAMQGCGTDLVLWVPMQGYGLKRLQREWLRIVLEAICDTSAHSSCCHVFTLSVRDHPSVRFRLLRGPSSLHPHALTPKRTLQHGGDIVWEEKCYVSPMVRVIAEGHANCLAELQAAGADVSDYLSEAIYREQPNCVRELLRLGAQVTTTRLAASWTTVLHLSIRQGLTAGCCSALLEFMDPNCADSSGRTPVHEAVEFSRHTLFPVLLRAGADFNRPDNAGDTPAHYATSPYTLEVLLRRPYCVDTTLKNSRGQTAFEVDHDTPLRDLFNALRRNFFEDDGSVTV